MALGARQLQFLIKKFVVEANIPGVFSGIGEINFLDPGPVDGGETHGAGFELGYSPPHWHKSVDRCFQAGIIELCSGEQVCIEAICVFNGEMNSNSVFVYAE